METQEEKFDRWDRELEMSEGELREHRKTHPAEFMTAAEVPKYYLRRLNKYLADLNPPAPEAESPSDSEVSSR